MITYKHIVTHPELGLEQLLPSYNPNVTPEIVKQYPHWNWNAISNNWLGLERTPFEINFEPLVTKVQRSFRRRKCTGNRQIEKPNRGYLRRDDYVDLD